MNRFANRFVNAFAKRFFGATVCASGGAARQAYDKSGAKTGVDSAQGRSHLSSFRTA
jgi:hypothetical protein